MRKVTLVLLGIVVLFVANIVFGSVHVDFDDVYAALTGGNSDDAVAFIILQHRLPQAITALLVGASLATAGLLLQTVFHNPLAGPGVLGISGGASLGVALVVLGVSIFISQGATSSFTLVCAAFVGAVLVTILLVALSAVLRNNVVLLVVGLLLGYLISAVITILNVVATPDNLHNYVVWGMGDFSSVGMAHLPMFALLLLVLLCYTLFLVKPLNVLQLGENYARNLGVDTNRLRNEILLIVGMLTAVTTAYCGPVSFLGLAIPHITRMIFRTSEYRVLIPANMAVGTAVALLCNIISTLPAGTLLPINAVTPLVGIPVIIMVVVRRR